MRTVLALTAFLAATAPACTDDDDSIDDLDDVVDEDDDDVDDDDEDDDVVTPTTFRIQIDNVAPWTMLMSGTQATKQGGAIGPLAPGETFVISFRAGVGQAISFATMLGESNDWFYGPGPDGIPLYDERGNARSGDVTAYVKLWDAGTELDQEPAVGDATAPRQPSPNFGAPDPQAYVRALDRVVTLDDGRSFTLPPVTSVIQAILVPGADRTFMLKIMNCSTTTTLRTSLGALPIHLSPLAWSMHIIPAPLFAPQTPDRGLGLERIAEDGMPEELGASLAKLTGFHTPLSPGVFALHGDTPALFRVGHPDLGDGLERIAEDGNPAPLRDRLAAIGRTLGITSSGAFDVPVGAAAPGPAMPGQSFAWRVTATPGDRMSFATMYGMSNDWFFAPVPGGIALFGEDRTPIAGDVTHLIALFDDGTEIDQTPAIGEFTAPQQPAPDTGPADPNRFVRDIAGTAPVGQHLRVTVSAE